MSRFDLSLVSLIRLVAPLALLAAGVGGCLMLGRLQRAPATSAPERLPPIVETAPVVRHNGGVVFQVDGEVIPYREIALAAEVSGRIQEKARQCRAGQFVRQGAELIQIDPRDYDLEIRRLQQMVEQAGVTIDELDVERANTRTLRELAAAESQLARRELQRSESLRLKNAASQSDLDEARRSEIQARNAEKTLENQDSLLETRRRRMVQQRRQLEVELEKARLDRTRTLIRAPLDGVVMDDPVEQDAYVQAGTPLVTIEDTSQVQVRFDLTAEQLQWLWAHSSAKPLAADQGGYQLPPVPVEVVAEVGGHEFVWRGELRRYDGAAINTATRTVPCIAVISNDGEAGRLATQPNDPAAGAARQRPTLLRGMFVRLRILTPANGKLLAVPESALRPGNRLWLLRDGKLALVEVRVAQTNRDTVLLVDEGATLTTADRVIVSPLSIAVEGMPLRDSAGASSQRPSAAGKRGAAS